MQNVEDYKVRCLCNFTIYGQQRSYAFSLHILCVTCS